MYPAGRNFFRCSWSGQGLGACGCDHDCLRLVGKKGPQVKRTSDAERGRWFLGRRPFPDKTGEEIVDMLTAGANYEITGAGYSAYGMIDARYALPEDMRPAEEESGGSGGSSGGCNTGIGIVALLAAVPLLLRRLSCAKEYYGRRIL